MLHKTIPIKKCHKIPIKMPIRMFMKIPIKNVYLKCLLRMPTKNNAD